MKPQPQAQLLKRSPAERARGLLAALRSFLTPLAHPADSERPYLVVLDRHYGRLTCHLLVDNNPVRTPRQLAEAPDGGDRGCGESTKLPGCPGS